MKTLKFPLLVLGFLSLSLFAACSDDDENSSPEDNCEIAIAAAAQAHAEYESATDENYTSVCAAYKAALEAQIEACGDADGSLQAIIDGLGNCTLAIDDDELSVVAGPKIDFDIVVVEVDNGLIKVSGESTFYGNSIYFEVAEGAEGETAMQNFQIIMLDKTFYPYVENGPYDFHSEIETNTEGILIGSFYGAVQSEDTSAADLTSGIINISY